ncbi:MAG: MarR family winged helix-turn-helix transcriptional regulator [Pseudomonadota bacterium]
MNDIEILSPQTHPGQAESFVDRYLLYIMAQASAAASSAFHGQLADMGVSVPKWRILASLYPDKSLNVGDLARKCLMKQPTLTRQLDRLCAEGLTERRHEDRDRRGVLVTLSAEGRARATRYVAMARQHESEILADYSAEEVAVLKDILIELAERARAKG